MPIRPKLALVVPGIFGLAGLLGPGCAHRNGADTEPEAIATQPEARPHRMVDGMTGEDLDPARLDERLMTARVVYVGEQHDNPHHHYVQTLLFERMYGLDPSVGLAMEMLTRDVQEVLTAYVQKKTDEVAFLAAVDWDQTWGFPFGLYQPLLDFARVHELPAFALNIPRTLTRALAKKGVGGLSDEERADLPDMEPGPAPHREFAREAFGKHSRSRFTDTKFEKFYAAQLAWDEGMATSVASALQGEIAPRRLLVIAGEGHTRRFAIPERAARRGSSPHLTILAIEPDELEAALADQVADVLYVFEPEAKAPSGSHP